MDGRSPASQTIVPMGVVVRAHRRPLEFHGRHIAIVDSHDDNRDLYAAWFASRGARVTSCATAAEAFDTIGLDVPDAVIVSVRLRREDGFALCDALMSRPETAHVRLIALTTCTVDHERAVGRGAFAAVMMIPCTFEALVSLATHVLRKARRQLAA